MNLKKMHIKMALKLMPKKELQEMAKLSEEEFIKKVKANKKSRDLSEETIKLMYNEMIKKIKKYNLTN